jgi:hypothetical protein
MNAERLCCDRSGHVDLAQRNKKQGIRNPVEKAREEMAAISGLSVDTMTQRLKRARQPQSKKGQKI